MTLTRHFVSIYKVAETYKPVLLTSTLNPYIRTTYSLISFFIRAIWGNPLLLLQMQYDAISSCQTDWLQAILLVGHRKHSHSDASYTKIYIGPFISIGEVNSDDTPEL